MSKELTTRATSDMTLSDGARRYVKHSRAANTVRTYSLALKEFVHYAGDLPAQPAVVADYLVALAEKGAKVSTIEVKLAGIAYGHRTAGYPDPTVTEAVKAVMDGIRREHGQPPAKREPAGLAEVGAMVGVLGGSLADLRDKALLLVGLAGAFRRSELVHLDVEDLTRDGDLLHIMIRRSKTDQVGGGQVKTIPHLDGNELDPVGALYAWLESAGIASGAIFRRIDRHGHVHGRLTAQSVALAVKRLARAAGLDWRRFSGHSLRSGFVTDALDGGASEADVMQQTGHLSDGVMRGYRASTGVGAARAVRIVFKQGELEVGE